MAAGLMIQNRANKFVIETVMLRNFLNDVIFSFYLLIIIEKPGGTYGIIQLPL